MNDEMIKSVMELIDETLGELEELKKSKFSAAEVDLASMEPGEDLNSKNAGSKKEVNGGIDKKEDKEDKEDEEKEESKKDEKEEDKKKVEKGILEEPEDKKKMKKEEDKEDEEEEKKKKEKDMEKKECKEEVKKSEQPTEDLFKSYVDSRLAPLESKIASILDVVNKIADQPVQPKGITARSVAPLIKNEGTEKVLNKSEIANKLFELKKSGADVDTSDIFKADTGADLESIVKKYKL